MSEPEKAKDYGEPIEPTALMGNGQIVKTRDAKLLEFDDFYERGIACINALRGVADPEAFVAAADALADYMEAMSLGGDLTAAYRAARGEP